MDSQATLVVTDTTDSQSSTQPLSFSDSEIPVCFTKRENHHSGDNAVRTLISSSTPCGSTEMCCGTKRARESIDNEVEETATLEDFIIHDHVLRTSTTVS